MNKREAIRNHRRLWKWLAENPAKNKEDWPQWATLFGVANSCFLCELTIGKNGDTHCSDCIGDWGSLKTCGTTSGKGLYHRWWVHALNHKKRTELALKIKDVVKAV